MRETKKSIPIIKTLIIFSLLVFVSSVVYISFFKGDQTMEVRSNVPLSKNSLRVKRIDNFVGYVTNRSDVPLSRKYLAEALLKLSGATAAIARAEEYEFQYADLIVADSDIERIAAEKLFSTQAYYLRCVASTLSNSLRKIQRQKFPQLNQPADELRAGAGRFNGTDLKLDQDQKIKFFLSKAVELVNAMR